VPFEIDHVFVGTEVGAPETGELIRFGLAEGRSNTHAGQGTASRHFFFRNASLELIWLHDDREACSSATRRTRLSERWHGRAGDACPFGLCVRPSDSSEALPFEAWEYAPSYIRKPWVIHIAANSDDVGEPMLFCIQGLVRPEAFPERYQQPLEHEGGFREITRLRWLRPDSGPLSPELNAIVGYGLLEIGPGASHALELGFDHEGQGKRASFAPALPISFCW
jgi:hypothetical protein